MFSPRDGANSEIAEPVMSGPASIFVCLPPELWERILLLLTPWEVLKLRMVKSSIATLWGTGALRRVRSSAEP